MARRNPLFASVIAVIISGSIGAFLFSLMNSNETKAVVQAPPIKVEAPTVEILVANHDITIGKKLTAGDLSWRKWPEALLNSEYITFNESPDYINHLIGGIAKMSIISGEPIIQGKIVQPGDRGAMAVLLRKGMRAVSVPITATSSAGGFILPGDFVDIILTTGIIRENLFKSETNTAYNTQNTGTTKAVLQRYFEQRLLSRSKPNDDKKTVKNNKKNKDDSQKEENNLLVGSEKTKEILENQQQDSVDTGNKVIVKPDIAKKLLNKEIAENNLIKKIDKEDELLVASSSEVTELMIENVRVLAIDQSANKAAQPQGEQSSASSIVGATATLEVTPEQAKLLAWSGNTGKITLSLRSFGETYSDEDGLQAYERLPITRTTFAWPIERVLDSTQNTSSDADTVIGNNSSLQIIRNGRISLLNSTSKSAINSGETDVKR